MATGNVKVNGDFSDLIKGAQEAAERIAKLGLAISGIGAAAKGFDLATTAIGGTVNTLAKLGQAAMGVEAVTKSVAAMGIGLLKGNADLEMTTISFQTLLGSASAAQDMIKQLTDFAQKTPFELTGLEANTQRLLAFGFQAKDIVPMMTSLGDAISALGGTQDNLNSLVYVMGQMRAEAHINAGDIMQMVNLGIPALQMLADHYHKTTGEIQEMISKGLIPGQEAVAIFTSSLESKYGGMMAAQSSTFNGMLSNLQDWASATTIILTKPFFEPAKKALQNLLDFVQSPAGVAAINRLAGYIQAGVDKMTAAFVEFEPKIRPVLQRVLQVAEAVRSQMQPGIAMLIPLLGQLWTRFEPVLLGFYKFYQSVSPTVTILETLRAGLTGGLNPALDVLKSRLSNIQNLITPILDKLSKFLGVNLSKPFNDLRAVFTSLISSIQKINLTRPFNDLKAVFTSLVSNLQKTVMPAFVNMVKFLMANFMPFFDRFTAFTAQTIIPVLASLAAFAMNVLVPAFVRLADILGRAFGPALNVIGKIITNELLPALTRLWGIFEARYLPTLQKLATQFGQVLANNIVLFDTKFKAALPTIETFFAKVSPLIVALVKFKEAISPIGIAFDALKGYVLGGVNGALDALRDRFLLIRGYIKIGLDFALVEIKKFGPTVLDWVIKTAVNLARQALTWGEALLQWVAPYAALLGTELINLGGRALSWVVGFAPVLANQALLWGQSIVSWILPVIPRLLNALGQFGSNLLVWFEQETPVLLGQAMRWADILAGWIIPAIPGVVAALEQLGAAIVNWGVTRLPVLLGNVVVGIGKGLGINLRPAVNDVLLVFNALVANITSTALPAFKQMTVFLAANVYPMLGTVAGFIANTVIPTVAALAAFTMTTLVPAFVAVAQILGAVFGPSLVLIGNLIRNELLPTLSELWTNFSTNYLPTIQTLAGELGEHLAGSVEGLLGKFQAALPVLEDFYHKIEPIVAKALELYAAISPLSIAFDVFSGFITGGVNGALDALQKHVSKVGDVFGIDLNGVIKNVTAFIQNQVVPVVKDMANWFEKHIIPIIGAVADTFQKDILPALGRFWDFAVKNILPALGDFFDWFSAKIIPVLGKLVAFVLDTVIPTLFNWWKTIATILQPIIEWLADFISNTLIPALTNIGKFINEKVLPVVTDLAKNFEKNLFPILKTIGDFLGGAFNVAVTVIGKVIEGVGWVVSNVLLPALDGLWHFISNFVLPVLKTVSDIFGTVLKGAITGFGWVVDNLIVPGFNTIKNAVGGVADFIKGAVKAVANFFVDAVNTPLNAINTLIDALQKIDILGAKPFEWLTKIPTLGYLSFAKGTKNAPGGLSLVGEQGMELIRMGQGSMSQLILATKPMLLDLPKGAQVFNNQQTLNMLPNPASAQQIYNMYQTSNATRNWDNSQTNSNNSQVNSNNTYYVNGQPASQWSFGQQYRWNAAR